MPFQAKETFVHAYFINDNSGCTVGSFLPEETELTPLYVFIRGMEVMIIISMREQDYYILIKTWEGLLLVFWTREQLSRVRLPPPPPSFIPK
jgi:hypothetical protein